MSGRASQAPMIAAFVLLVATTAAAQTTSPPAATGLPPMSAPPEDVPMHVPQPPRDPGAATSDAPAMSAPVPNSAAPARPPAMAAARRGATITPTPPLCRDATYNVIIDGRPELAHARVCRTPDGTWRLAP